MVSLLWVLSPGLSRPKEAVICNRHLRYAWKPKSHNRQGCEFLWNVQALGRRRWIFKTFSRDNRDVWWFVI